jgi:Fur family ferric uptake transcriptional regulator
MILEEVRASKSHPTADDIYDRVKRKLPRISLGTVYRNLEALASQGAIQRLDLSGVQRRFDHEPVPHYHVRCIQCGSLGDVSLKPDVDVGELLEEGSGFEVLAVRLEFLGTCPQCRGMKTSPND